MDREINMHHHLERILLDKKEVPTKLPMWLLESITDNFSDANKIGGGGFADVYMGLLRSDQIVAVKKLRQSEMVEMHEAKFTQEVVILMKLNHKNIVRLLGFCSDTQGNILKHEGNHIMAEERQRFLCFEYMPEGSLDKYMSGTSQRLKWMMWFQIIKGICEGLHYLHQQRVVHSDLKPANILLDHGMMPKIADFGLAQCFDEGQTQVITRIVFGSLGYMAPECYSGVIAFKSDIYSLGIIIIEILTGQKMYRPINEVIETWKARFQIRRDTWLEHVIVCAKMALKCMDSNPENRPTTQHIIDQLHELEKYKMDEQEFKQCSWSGEWEIDKRLLEMGGMISSGDGRDVYHGTYLGEDVAVKVLKSWFLNSDACNEFKQEVYILREVHHTNVVRFIGACTKEPQLCIITEYMSGGNLYDFLHKQHNVLNLTTQLKFAVDVCRGMCYLHERGIIHRNLKTCNLLMDKNHVVKVAGFTVAQFEDQRCTMTAEVGTYRWVAPEIINHKPYEYKADVFSFAVVLWELATSKIPYGFLTPLQAALGVRQGLRLDFPKYTHRKLLDLTNRYWEADPSNRPAFSDILAEREDLLAQAQGASKRRSKGRTRHEQRLRTASSSVAKQVS